jgi:4-hydroxy-tetrahydrodipicolinate reductase
MSRDIRVLQYGLGPIGSAIARHVVHRPGLCLVGAVDVDPAKVGVDIGRVIDLGRPLDRPVTGRLAQIATEVDVVTHATNSYFSAFKGQIIEILEAGLDVVSTAEELSFPWLAHPQEAVEVDAVAKQAGKTVLGTGVNPGFIMDYLPLCLSAICQRVDHVDVTRVINASARRGPFQAKIGCGMTVKDFADRMAAGRMGHVGLSESMDMVSDTLGRSLTHREYDVEPLVANRVIRTDYVEVQPGRVMGLRQVARGHTAEGEFLRFTFIASLDVEDDLDTVRISGEPDLEIKLKGAHGDLATVAIAVNAIRRVREAPAGLVTMRDLPIVTA